MDVNKLSFTRLVPERPGDLGKILAEQKNMDLYEKLRSGTCGMIPGQPEGFATLAARDAAVGPCGNRMTFIATSWPEAQTGGFTAACVAIGHPLGGPGFDRVAEPVIDAVVRFMTCTSFPGSLVIARTRYEVHFDEGCQVIVEGDLSQRRFAADEQQIATTERWLREVFTDRLFTRSTCKSYNI